MSLKWSTKLLFLASVLASSGVYSASEECECKKIVKKDQDFSHTHYLMMDYSLDSFQNFGDQREPQYSMGSSLLYHTKEFAFFSDVLVGNSSSKPRPILDGNYQNEVVKQLGVSVPFTIQETNNRFYVGKIALPTGFYERQRTVPTIDNGHSLTDSFISNWYTQYIPPESPGLMLESQYGNFMVTLGYFKPEELTSNFQVNVGGLAPFLPYIPPGTTFPFFSGAADIVVDNRGTNPFPDKLSLPIAIQRNIYYASLIYDNTTDFIGKIEYLRNDSYVYTNFSPVDNNDIIKTYNKETLGELQEYYRIGLEKRFLDINYLKFESYLEQADLYDGYNFRHRADAIGFSRSYDSYTLHTSYVYWHEAVIGYDREFSAGVSTVIGERTSVRMMYRRMKGETAQASFRAGTNDPQFKAFYDVLEALNPGFSGPTINKFELSGLELRVRYDF